MKWFLTLACLLALVVTEAAAQPVSAARWKRYTVKGEDFSVIFPTLPAMATDSEPVTRLGKSRQRRMLGAYADGLVFTVFCIENTEPRESLDDFIEQEIFSHSGWDRASEQELKRNGFSGRQYQSPNKVPGTMQIYAAGDRIYRIQAFGAGPEDERVKQYFASLILGKKSHGVVVADGDGLSYDASAAADDAKPFTIREVDRRPVVLMRPEPNYTDEARKNGVAGPVVLKAVFSSNGNVVNVRAASSLPDGLTEQAMAAARKIKFIPALKGGKFVSTTMQLEYHFNLE